MSPASMQPTRPWVGVHWLVQEIQAEERIQGHRAFRPMNGYSSLLGSFGANWKVPTCPFTPRRSLSTCSGVADMPTEPADREMVLRRHFLAPPGPRPGAAWRFEGSKRRTGNDRLCSRLASPKACGSRQNRNGNRDARRVAFSAALLETIPASTPSSEEEKTLDGMGFLFSDDGWFPTWWTTEPRKSPIITGWAPFLAGARLSGQSEAYVIDHCLNSLGRLLHLTRRSCRRSLRPRISTTG